MGAGSSRSRRDSQERRASEESGGGSRRASSRRSSTKSISGSADSPGSSRRRLSTPRVSQSQADQPPAAAAPLPPGPHPLGRLSSGGSVRRSLREEEAGWGAAPPSPAQQFAAIPDTFETLPEVAAALQRRGLQRCDLMLAMDFTKSNSWTGRLSFGGRCLHDTATGTANPYERVVNVLGRTVEHMLGRGSDPAAAPPPLLCFGFGDASTGDGAVFSFFDGNRPAAGFKHALERYRQLASTVVLAGPTSFGPAIRAATAATLERGNPFTVLVLIADGQVTRSADTPAGELSPQEADTIDALVQASSLVPLAVVMIGVGDGPWETMQQFDDLLPSRRFDNWQFVSWAAVSASVPRASGMEAVEAAFALACLQEVPAQYEQAKALGLLGRGGGGGGVRVAGAGAGVPAPVRILPPPQAPMQPQPRRSQGGGQFRQPGFGAPLPPSAPPMPPAPRPPACVVCQDAPRDCVLLPCGHTCLCLGCAGAVVRLGGEGSGVCPICRGRVTAVNKIFLS